MAHDSFSSVGRTNPEASCLRLEMTSVIRGNRTARGILLDLDGVVYVGRRVLPGSLDAISRIRAAKLPLKFITNTTRRSLRRIVSDLAQLGLQVTMEDVYTRRKAAP